MNAVEDVSDFEAQRRLAALTESDVSYLAWENVALAGIYPGDAFTLCGKAHVCRRRPAPPAHALPRTGRSAFRFDHLVAVADARVDDEIYDASASAHLAYMTRPGGPVRFPDRPGFAARKWNFDGVEPLVEVGMTRYRDTIASGFLLQREMQSQYEVVPPHVVRTPAREQMGLLQSALPVMQSHPRPYHPALGVQALVVVVREGVPRVAVITRSLHVAARPGWLQFPPSGGMEFFGTLTGEITPDLRVQSDPGHALRREFLEEIFAIDEDESGDAETFENLVVSPRGARVGDAFEEGRAEVRFLGVVSDAMTGRPELSFLIIAREVDWQMSHSEESQGAPVFLTFPDLACDLADPATRLCPSSAGLLRLAIDGGSLDDAGVLSRPEARRLFR